MDWKQLLLEVALGVLAVLGSWVLAKVKTLINTKVKNEKARELLNAATSAVSSTVKATYQTYVENIKGTDAWTVEAQKLALAKAVEAAKAQMSAEVQAYIKENYGDVETWLTNAIEAEIYTLKNGAKAAE